jgi:HAD superfamily hydrolase (TIGR01459 family)
LKERDGPGPAASGGRTGRTVPVIGGIGELVQDFDGFILDLWGVIHGGVEPYPGVLATLEQLRSSGKPAALLSNAPRRALSARQRLRQIGVPDGLYRALITSGEAAHEALRDRCDPDHAALGRRYLYIGPPWDNDLVRDLDYSAADTAQDADFLLCVGLFDEADPLSRYDDLFRAACASDAPMVCVNPDLVVHRQSGVAAPCAGLLAQHYRDRHGGRAIYHGKPDPKVFEHARAALELDSSARVLVVGDSLTTDIRGARAAGLPSVFVTRGIFAAELGIEPGEEPDAARVEELCERYGERPVAAIATLRW